MTLIAQVTNRGSNGFGSTINGQPVGQQPPATFGGTTGNETLLNGTAVNDLNLGGVGELTLTELVQMIIVYAFIIAAALSAIFIFIGGINFILSGGSDDKIKQAVNTIRYSIIGLIITILSFTFVTIVGRVFGLNFLDYISYDQIKNSINRLVNSAEVSNGESTTFAPR